MPFNQEYREMKQFETEYAQGYNSAKNDEAYHNPYSEDGEIEKHDMYKEGYNNFKYTLSNKK